MKIKTIMPVGRAVLLELTMPDQIRGLFLPQNYKGQAGTAKVLAVGDEVTRCKVGDFVMLGTRGKIMDADFSDPSRQLIESDEYIVAIMEYEEESRIVSLSEVAQA